ncbi:MAG: aspartate kinase, partial [Oscillospiraceae bacterium]|nr:aspartate kinase [Oscillospiraceae bacterium]
IYTDVDGVYTADPRILPEARKLERVSYGDMLEMAEQGAKVLHSRCVELAQAHGLEFEVCSSLRDVPGTLVAAGEARKYCGVAVLREGDAARVSLIGCGCGEQETAAQVLRALSPLTLLHFVRRARCISVTVPQEEADEAARTLHYLFLS